MPGVSGTAEMYTIDPVNIQAILATNFKDFKLGERRIREFKPLLGDSILNADGASWEHSRDQINDLEKT